MCPLAHSPSLHLHLVRRESRAVSSAMPLYLDSADPVWVKAGYEVMINGPCDEWHWETLDMSVYCIVCVHPDFLKLVYLSSGWASWHIRPRLSKYDQVNCPLSAFTHHCLSHQQFYKQFKWFITRRQSGLTGTLAFIVFFSHSQLGIM